MMNDRGTEKAECENKVMNKSTVAETIKALVNEKGLKLKCTRVLHESFWIQTDGCETLAWKERERG